MNILLDTHTILWFLNGDERLSKKVREIIENFDNLRFISIATIWELAIRTSLEKFHIVILLTEFSLPRQKMSI
mgnify:FL=1